MSASTTTPSGALFGQPVPVDTEVQYFEEGLFKARRAQELEIQVADLKQRLKDEHTTLRRDAGDKRHLLDVLRGTGHMHGQAYRDAEMKKTQSELDELNVIVSILKALLNDETVLHQFAQALVGKLGLVTQMDHTECESKSDVAETTIAVQEVDLIAAELELNDLKSDLGKATKNLEDITADRIGLQLSLKSTELELSVAQAIVAQQKIEISSLELDIEKRADELSTTTKGLENIMVDHDGCLKSIENDLSIAKITIKKQETDLLTANSLLSERTSKFNTTTKDLEDAMLKRDELQQALEITTEKLTTANVALGKEIVDREKAQADLKEKAIERDDFRASLTSVQDTKAALDKKTTELKTAEQRLSSAEKTVSDYKTELRDVKDELWRKNRELLSLKATLDTAKASQGGGTFAMQHQLAKEETQLKKTEQVVRNTQNEIKACQTELDQARPNLAPTETEDLAKTRLEVETSKEINRLQMLQSAKKEVYKSLNSQVNQLKEELAKTRELLDDEKTCSAEKDVQSSDNEAAGSVDKPVSIENQKINCTRGQTLIDAAEVPLPSSPSMESLVTTPVSEILGAPTDNFVWSDDHEEPLWAPQDVASAADTTMSSASEPGRGNGRPVGFGHQRKATREVVSMNAAAEQSPVKFEEEHTPVIQEKLVTAALPKMQPENGTKIGGIGASIYATPESNTTKGDTTDKPQPKCAHRALHGHIEEECRHKRDGTWLKNYPRPNESNTSSPIMQEAFSTVSSALITKKEVKTDKASTTVTNPSQPKEESKAGGLAGSRFTAKKAATPSVKSDWRVVGDVKKETESKNTTPETISTKSKEQAGRTAALKIVAKNPGETITGPPQPTKQEHKPMGLARSRFATDTPANQFVKVDGRIVPATAIGGKKKHRPRCSNCQGFNHTIKDCPNKNAADRKDRASIALNTSKPAPEYQNKNAADNKDCASTADNTRKPLQADSSGSNPEQPPKGTLANLLSRMTAKTDEEMAAQDVSGPGLDTTIDERIWKIGGMGTGNGYGKGKGFGKGRKGNNRH